MKPRTAVVTVTMAAALIGAPAAAAFDQTSIPYQPGDPQLNGCPSGWEAMQVSDLAAAGYMLPAKIDSGQVGNEGNNDGVVCGKPVSAAEQTARFSDEGKIIFDFRDNTEDGH